MQINNNLNTNPKRQRFGNITTASTQVLRYLNTSPAIGASFVDLGSMSAPRTIVDFSRNPDAGLETGIRECSGTANHALIGTYGLLASTLIGTGINRKYNVKSNKVFANFETIDTLGAIWNDVVKSNKDATPIQMRKIFFENILNNIEGNAHSTKDGLKRVPVDEKSIRLVVGEVSDFIDKNPEKYSLPSKILNKIKSILTCSTTAESDFLVKSSKNSAISDLDSLMKSSFSLGKIFSEPKALSEFKNSSDILSNNFIKALKRSKLQSSLLGVAMGMAVGASIQPLNVWLTKKRTGKEGFVGVEGCKQDKSNGFKLLKGASAAGFLAFAYSTIVDNIFKTPITKQAGQLLNRLQFNGIVPSIPQFKAVYAFTIASRIMSARDKNELRESVTKDFLGFTNWLILGGFVEKMVATLKNQSLTTYDEKVHGKGILNKIFNLNVKVKTHDEILFEELKKINIDYRNLCSVDGKMLPIKDLIKNFGDKLPELKARLRGKNIAQLSGYLYSAAVLGILIPKLNIYITNKSKNKHCANIAGKREINSQLFGPTAAFKAFEKV